MKSVRLSEIYLLKSCRKEFQVADSYCPWSKIACCVLGTRQITSSPCFAQYGIGEIYPEPAKFFQMVIDRLGSEVWNDVLRVNDSMDGHFDSNHEKALSLALQHCLAAGIIELEPEEGELVRELRRRLLPNSLPA